MDFLVLGPVEVRSADAPIHVGGVRQRSILALLIANRGEVLSADLIVDEVYGEDAASGARRSVQSIISMLRRVLGDVIVGRGGGYVFDAPRDAVDWCRFEDGVASGLDLIDTDPQRAAAVLWESLGLWRGVPYSGVDGRGVFEVEAARLSELRFVALEARFEADLACGRHREVVAELEALVAEYPLRESLWGLWMLALYRTGRQADALAVYQQLRTVLGEGLGLEPSDEVRRLEDQILLHDAALDLVPEIPHNLPTQLTSFVGRRLELIELGELLADTRLVTLAGAGGSGKTRLATEFGRQVLDDYPDGVWFVDLRGVDAGGAVPLIASTLGAFTSGGTPIVDQLVDALAGRRLLLVLDNCEHVLDTIAPFVDRLVGCEGRVRVLATSRESLGVPGESMILVHPLPLPESTGPDRVAVSDAIALFAERSSTAQPGFMFEEHLDAVFEICRAVDGLPLAIELAAARLAVFAPEELAVRLDDQLSTLRSSQRAGDLRHATIEATIDWSWELLDDAERALAGRLSVFHRSWSLDAAEAICGFEPIGRDQVVDLVSGLVAKSLVVVDGAFRGVTRYRLLEPIRHYAARELDDQATGNLCCRFVDYWSAMLAESYDLDSPVAVRDHKEARALEPDQANLAAAVEWALESERFNDAMIIFASPFGDLLMIQGTAMEPVSRWIETALHHRDALSPGPLVWSLEVAGRIAGAVSSNEVWLGYATLGVENARSADERLWFELHAAVATNKLEGHTAATDAMFDRVIDQANHPGMRASALLAKAKFAPPMEAWEFVDQAMMLSPIDSLGFYDEANACGRILDTAGDSGHYDIATQMAERALQLSQQSGWVMRETQAASALTWLYAARGRLDEAAALITEMVPVARRIIGPTMSRPLVPERAASIARQLGRFDEARSYAEEALQAAEETEIGVWTEAMPLFTIRERALIARDEGDLDQAQHYVKNALQRLETVTHVSIVPWIRTELRTARASIALRREAPHAAMEDLRAVLAESRYLQHSAMVATIDLIAIALAQQGNAEHATRLLGAVDRERERTGLVIRPPDTPIRESAMHDAQTALGHQWDAIVEDGRAMNLDEALACAVLGAEGADLVNTDTNQADSDTVVST